MNSLKTHLLVMVIILLNACATIVPAPKPLSSLRTIEPLASYSRVLQSYVNERGEVDFPALQIHRTDLDNYIAYVAQLPATSISNVNERLAHYINSYNALSMYNVLESGIPKTNAGSAKIRFFYLRKLLIGGKQMSLYDYENDLIRVLKEPRVHFALNCSALSCPVLPRTLFSGANLNQELDREAHKFFSEQRNLRIDHAGKKIHVSELLDFYPDDFLSADTPTLIAYINRYAPEKIPYDYTIEFIPYDWTIANSSR
jgi:Protein of unknown function, DUF547